MQSSENFDFPGVYKITNTKTGKVYVGQARNIAARFREHQRIRNKGTRLYNAVKKYGWGTFTFEVLERVDDEARLDSREQYWMDTLKAWDEAHGYNICREAGTTRGRQHSEATRRKMSERASQRTGELNPFYGRSHSDKTKELLAQSRRGQKISEQHKQKLRTSPARQAASAAKRKAVLQIDPNTGEVVQRWESAALAQKTLGLSRGSITQCCKGYYGQKTAGGYTWRYAE